MFICSELSTKMGLTMPIRRKSKAKKIDLFFSILLKSEKKNGLFLFFFEVLLVRYDSEYNEYILGFPTVSVYIFIESIHV
jgi:hypothetical protein